jgi:hypothetical protein
VTLLHLRTEADPVSETSCYLIILNFRTMDRVQKPISSQCYIQSSGPFKIHILFCFTCRKNIFQMLESVRPKKRGTNDNTYFTLPEYINTKKRQIQKYLKFSIIKYKITSTIHTYIQTQSNRTHTY